MKQILSIFPSTLLRASFLLALLLSACVPVTTAVATETSSVATEVPATEAPATEAVVQVEPTAKSSALFKIIKSDGTKFDVTLEAVKGLPLAQVTAEDGKVQEGPKLLDILALAGVTEFIEVTLTGSASPATLTFEQVDDNTILDFNNHGTLKLSTTYIPKVNWTKDISEITVK